MPSLLKQSVRLAGMVLGLVMVVGGALAGPAYMSPEGICTKDINACGNASACICADGYAYSSGAGLCVATDVNTVDTACAPLADSRCVVSPRGICTQDINAAGHASACQCDAGFAYSPVLGKCVAAP